MRSDNDSNTEGCPLALVLTGVISLFLMMIYLADLEGACAGGVTEDSNHDLFCAQAREEQESYLALYLEDRREYRSIRED